MRRRRPTPRWFLTLLLLPMLLGLIGAALPSPDDAEAAPLGAFGSRRYTVPAGGTLSVTIRAYCLDKPRHFPGAYLEPSDLRVDDNVLRTFAYSVAKGYTRKQIYQTQLAIWYLRENGQWFTVPGRPQAIAEEIVRQGGSYGLPEKPTDAPTLMEAVQAGKIRATVNDFHATTENYEGTGTLVMENLTDEPVTLYITVGTVFNPRSDGEQRMIGWAQGGLGGYTRTAATGGYTLNMRSVESRRFPLVNAAVSVIDGRQMPVRDLPPERFEVIEDGKPVQNVTVKSVIGSSAEEPASLIVLVDQSEAAAAGPAAENTLRLAADFIEGLKSNDQVMVMGFGEKISVLQSPTADKTAAARAVLAAQPEPGSRYYDAIAAALEQVGKLPNGRKGIVVFASGRDSGSDPDPADVIDWAAEQGTPMYTVAGPTADRSTLDPFAEATGGLAFGVTDPASVATAYDSLSSYLREHYRIEFASNLRADGLRHKLTVRVKDDEGQRPADDQFLAYKNPPSVEMVTPKENAQLQPNQRVEFNVRSLSPVSEVELIADGKPLTKLTEEPWVYDWATEGMTRGQHSLNIVVRDRAGNQSTKVVPLVVAGDAPLREQLSRPVEVVQRAAGPDIMPIALGAIGLAVLGAGGFFGVKRGLPELRRRIPSRCPVHGTTFPQNGACPLCVADARKQITERLGQYTRPGLEQPGD